MINKIEQIIKEIGKERIEEWKLEAYEKYLELQNGIERFGSCSYKQFCDYYINEKARSERLR